MPTPSGSVSGPRGEGGITNRLLDELKRRNVFRVGAAYAVTAWLVLQLADILLDNYGAPAWVFKSLVPLLLVGFPIALLFAWAYEITPEGIKRERDVVREASAAQASGRRLEQITIVMIVAALTVLAVDRIWLGRPAQGPTVAGPIAGASPDPARDAMQPLRAAGHSIAVLPFVNMSPDPEQEYFSDGLAEEILNLLAQIGELKVIGRTSSFAFKGRNEDLRSIGATLNVNYLLEGSVRKYRDQLRITAQLIEVQDGSHLWSQTFDRRMENVFAIQTEIAASIARALQVSLVGADDAVPVAQAAGSLPAYERYLQARRLIHGRSREGLLAARALLEEALSLDPDYAPAMAAAGLVQLLLASDASSYGDIPLTEAVAQARAYLDLATTLDPQLADTHAVRGLMYNLVRDFAAADAALVRALDLNPSQSDALNWRAINLFALGHLRESLAVRRMLAEIDPLHLTNLINLVFALQAAGLQQEALELAVRIQRGFPESPYGFLRHAELLFSSGRLADALYSARQASELDAGSVPVSGTLSTVLLLLGDFEGVLEFDQSYDRGRALVGLGRADEAVAAAEARSAAAPWDSHANLQLLQTLSLAGRYEQLLSVYEERWGSLEMLESAFGFERLTDEFTQLAAAQRALGRQEDLAVTLARWRERLAILHEQGLDTPDLDFVSAAFLVLNGEHECALVKLAVAIDRGYRTPLLARNPVFAELHDHPAFQTQVERLAALINAERGKLGMDPLS